MGYTLSFDANIKVKAMDVKGWLHHAARDVDQQQGQEVRHSNQDIDSTRTASNETAYYDQVAEQHDQCRDISQVEQSIAARLATVTKPLRKDAVVLRPLILQLDPAWYAAHQSDAEREQAATDMMEWAIDTFGEQNLVLMSRHRDESNEHLHLGFCPVTDDGRLSQKDWFSSPKKLQAMHQDFREFMRDRGYDIDLTNKKPGKYAKRLSETEYKDFAELEKQRRELEAREKAIQVQEQDLQRRSLVVKAREAAMDEREAKAEAKEQGATKALKTALQARKEAAELLDDIQDQKAREGLESRLRGLERQLPSGTPDSQSERNNDFSL
uniref:Plasmid recombination enzyme n=1 Tax=uncultured prokaryote TaxID=198431 RepID=A0A0H5Q2Z2_9ZZZZ|nr:hypothetical protein [uncultured prokaryote]